MITKLRSLLALLALAPGVLFAHERPTNPAQNCGCACCQDRATCCCHEAKPVPDAGTPDHAQRYPLKGVIVDIYPDQSSLLVKHEAIPGYMMAMTMVFKVDAATLKAAVKGEAITATLVERDDGLWLEKVQLAGK
jgi:Cu/Ag efflux protein CusF